MFWREHRKISTPPQLSPPLASVGTSGGGAQLVRTNNTPYIWNAYMEGFDDRMKKKYYSKILSMKLL